MRLASAVALLLGSARALIVSTPGGCMYRLESPCSASTARPLVGAVADDAVGDSHWIALHALAPSANLDAPVDAPAAPVPAPVVTPIAVGRLNRRLGMLSRLQTSLEKEDPAALRALGVVLDALVITWCEAIDDAALPADFHFESLTASASTLTAPLYERRGFAAIEEPDLTALGRNAPLATHRARLPAAIVACECALAQLPNDDGPAQSQPGDEERDRGLLEQLLRALKAQPGPPAQRPEAPPETSEADRAAAYWKGRDMRGRLGL